jgi:hypothetical protein
MLEFSKDPNLKLVLFDVGNNVDHIGLKVTFEEEIAPFVTWDLGIVN